jgi:hypothetical protein
MTNVDLRYKEHKKHETILSVDLGKARDFTAFVVAEAKEQVVKNLAGRDTTVMTLEVLNARRLPLGTDYTRVAKEIHVLYQDRRLWLQRRQNHALVSPELLVDAGGVGDGVCDIVEKHMGIKPIRYKLVRGTAGVNRHGKYSWTVPRSRIFSMLDGAFSSDRIIIDPRLSLAEELIGELQNLKLEQDEETGYIKVTHREGEHDDLAICLAAANWWASEPRPNNTLRVIR